LRSENRFLAAMLTDAGFRTIQADLPGHGRSPITNAYGVQQTAAALLGLIDELDAGPAIVVANSFAPAAVVWAATERPEGVSAMVAISPHFTADATPKGRAIKAATRLLLRGPWAASIWERLYRSWYKGRTPEDLEGEIAGIREMLSDPARRRAVRETLTADRIGVAERMSLFNGPALIVFGAVDDHFPEPAEEARQVATQLAAEILIVDGAGHYPQVERPEVVGPAVVEFLGRLPR
jgi:pimeloyl-ACP methyl ester carboxylesterase